MTMAAFIARLRHDRALRDRFAENPRSVLREHGIDPLPFALPERLDDAQLENLLADWSTRTGQAPAEPRGAAEPKPRPPAPVYGPPPGPRTGVPEVPSPSPTPPPSPAPPAPVYGPPPGMPRPRP